MSWLEIQNFIKCTIDKMAENIGYVTIKELVQKLNKPQYHNGVYNL